MIDFLCAFLNQSWQIHGKVPIFTNSHKEKKKKKTLCFLKKHKQKWPIILRGKVFFWRYSRWFDTFFLEEKSQGCTLRQNFMFSSSKYAIETSKSILYFGHQYSKCNEKKKSFQNWIFEHLIEVCHIVCWHQSFEKALAQMLRHRHQGSKDYLALSRGRWAGLSNEYIFGEGKTESDQWDEFLITHASMLA